MPDLDRAVSLGHLGVGDGFPYPRVAGVTPVPVMQGQDGRVDAGVGIDCPRRHIVPDADHIPVAPRQAPRPTGGHFKRASLSVEEPLARVKRGLSAAMFCSARLWWHVRAGGDAKVAARGQPVRTGLASHTGAQ